MGSLALSGGRICAPEVKRAYHTYSCYARRISLEAFNSAYQLLDRAPRGRDEDDLPARPAWIRRHDEYENPAAVGTA
jgi:predicted dithiol-disulfide oxidoreductase (DUF899 family)